MTISISMSDIYKFISAREDRFKKDKLILRKSLSEINDMLLRKGELSLAKQDIDKFAIEFRGVHNSLYNIFLELAPLLTTFGCINMYILQTREGFFAMQKIFSLLYSEDIKEEVKYDIAEELFEELFKTCELLQRKTLQIYADIINKH